AHDGERVDGGLADPGPADQAESAARVAALHCDVLGDAHPIDEAEILVDEGDGQRVDAGAYLLAGEEDLACIRRIDARQDLDQRRFSRAILPKECMDLAMVEIEIDMVESQRAGESLREARDREEAVGGDDRHSLGFSHLAHAKDKAVPLPLRSTGEGK